MVNLHIESVKQQAKQDEAAVSNMDKDVQNKPTEENTTTEEPNPTIKNTQEITTDQQNQQQEAQKSVVNNQQNQQQLKPKPSFTPEPYSEPELSLDNLDYGKIGDSDEAHEAAILNLEQQNQNEKDPGRIISESLPDYQEHDISPEHFTDETNPIEEHFSNEPREGNIHIKRKPNSNNKLYADSINEDGSFNNVTEQPDSNSTYEISNNNNNGIFTIYDKAHDRILKDTNSLNGSETQKVSENPNSTKTESGNTVFDKTTGKWKITKKAKVIVS